VEEGSVAGEKKLRAGDVIVEISSQPVKTVQEVSGKIEADAKAGKKVVLLLISREGDLTFVGLALN
jgi:serine protease Do